MCRMPKCTCEKETSKIHSTKNSNSGGYLNKSVQETSILKNAYMSENEYINRPSGKEHKSCTKPVISSSPPVLNDTIEKKSPERHKNMNVTSNTEKSKVNFTPMSQVNCRSLLSTGSSPVKNSGSTSLCVSSEHSEGPLLKIRGMSNDTRCQSSLFVGSLRSEFQHDSSSGEITESCKSLPGESLPPKTNLFEICQRNTLSRHQEANGNSEVNNSFQSLTAEEDSTKTLKGFRNRKHPKLHEHLQESPEKESSALLISNITRTRSCVIINVKKQQQTKENTRDAQGGFIKLDHLLDKRSKLADFSTYKILPRIPAGNRGEENSCTQPSYADWQVAENNTVEEENSNLLMQETSYPGVEHSYSRNMKKWLKSKNINRALGSSVLKHQFKALETSSRTEISSKMQDHSTAVNSSLQSTSSSLYHIHTSEDPSITKPLIIIDTSERGRAHSVTKDHSSAKKSVDSLLKENESSKLCSTRASETPSTGQHLKTLEVTKESEALNRIHNDLTTATSVDTLGTHQASRSSEASSVIEDYEKPTFMDSSVEKNEVHKHCITHTEVTTEHLKITQANSDFEVPNVTKNHMTSSTSVDSVRKQKKPNHPDTIATALETTSTVDHLKTREISSTSPTGIPDHLTPSKHGCPVLGSSSSNQQMSERYVCFFP